jgi:FkbM family methyltransferase
VDACTIVASNYLPMARVLAESFLTHHPGARFSVLVIDGDRIASPRSQAEAFTIVLPQDLDLEMLELHRMAMAYDVTELSTALKPWLLEHLLASGADTVIYLDPDINVYASIESIANLAQAHGVVVTPHLLTPLPRDGLQPSERQILGSGAFNLGFIAVGRSARPFLAWWRERLARDAISDQSQSLFTDQRWVDLLPSLFPHVVLRDRGCNVAYWNVDARPIARTPTAWTAGGEPLTFFHFSGYRPHRPWLLSHHAPDRPRVRLSEHPDLRALCDKYASALRSHGAHDLHGEDYGWARLPHGRVVLAGERRYFRKALLKADQGLEPYPPDPFDALRPEAYEDWWHEPVENGRRVPRIVFATWSARPDLQRVFPDPLGGSQEHLLAWLAEHGYDELGITRERRPNLFHTPQSLLPPAEQGAFGVNIVGYLKAELGVGQIGRFAVEASQAAGIEVTTLAYDRTVNRQDDPFVVTPSEVLHAVNIVAVNADQLHQLARDFGPSLLAERPTIGIWAWEVEEFPASLHGAFDLVDEVWALSKFSANTLAQVSPVPVHVFPSPIRPLAAPVRSRVELGLPEGTVFLFAFDHMSVLDRKNPHGLIEAYRKAFAPGEASLVLKSINGDRFPADQERLRYLTADRKDILLREGFEAGEDVHALMSSVDCYVSLHRSEGYGLTMAEAMALGTPVIATAYSGNLDFMDADTAMLVPYRLSPVPPTAAPYPTTASWAEPDLDAAAAFLRWVHDNPAAARALGERGRAAVLANHPLDQTAQFIRDRVRAHLPSPHGTLKSSPARPGDHVRAELALRPDIDTAARHPAAARLMRRGVNRLLAHHDEHLARQSEQVVTLIEQLTAQQQHEISQLKTQLEVLRVGFTEEGAHRQQAEREVGRLREELDRRVLSAQTRADQALGLAGNVSCALASAGPAIAVPCDVGLLHLPARDSVIAPWLREYGNWEPSESAAVASILRPGDAFLDVGAHVGYHVLRAAHLVGTRGRVLAIEPSPEVIGLLRHNLAVNLPSELQSIVDVLAIAAWDVDARLSLILSPDGNSGATRVEPDPYGDVAAYALGSRPEVLRQTWRLVMTDLEGYDHRALRGLLPILRRDRPHVLTEFNPASMASVGENPEQALMEYASWGYNLQALATGLTINPLSADVVRAAKESDSGFLSVLLIPQ